ncbi:(2Fe-2S)-binding protein [Paenibacillus spongiae]|uniref:(2Fe-2S)-binding protein n=2 Tax=Paenibacillus spongiae TaxID=2909671 RepID=A0ABY5SHU2_9BACL|nr:(2Fe-2S)-binding protein [Paenibacillus spongiae]
MAGDVVLIGRSIRRQVAASEGVTILELAQKHEVDWNSNCKRGTCARCRCLVVDGSEFLTETNEAELNRLEPEELEEGYRLACQTRIRTAGPVTVKYKPYF